MQLDVGLQGLGILLACAFLFGGAVQVVFRSRTHWLWLIAAAGWFVGGLVASEIFWGTLTEDEIQPIIDGLAFDESLLGGLIGGVLAVLATWLVTGRRATESTAEA